MRIVFVFFTLFIGINLFGKCYWVACTPEGNSGEQQVNANISSQSNDINKKLDELKSKVNREKELLDTILKKQDEYIRLTSTKEVYLKYLIDNSSSLTHLVRSQEQ